MALLGDIQALMDRYAECYRAGNAEGCAAIYAEDACLYSPFGPPALGRAAIAAAHRAWFAEPEENKRLSVQEAGGDGDLAWALIAYSADVATPDGGVHFERGHTLSVFRRQPDGGWLTLCSSLTPEVA